MIITEIQFYIYLGITSCFWIFSAFTTMTRIDPILEKNKIWFLWGSIVIMPAIVVIYSFFAFAGIATFLVDYVANIVKEKNYDRMTTLFLVLLFNYITAIAVRGFFLLLVYISAKIHVYIRFKKTTETSTHLA